MLLEVEDGPAFQAGSEADKAWFICFYYFNNKTFLKIPPQTGEWLHLICGYLDGRTELSCSWDGGAMERTENTFAKETLRTDVYFGCEVDPATGKVARPFLGDLAYVRVWDSYEPAEKIHEQFQLPQPTPFGQY